MLALWNTGTCTDFFDTELIKSHVNSTGVVAAAAAAAATGGRISHTEHKENRLLSVVNMCRKRHFSHCSFGVVWKVTGGVNIIISILNVSNFVIFVLIW